MAAEQSDAVNARKARWHQSTLSTLLDGCSWQYFLTYIMELPTGDKPYATVGTAFHAAVEHHELRRKDGLTTTMEEMVELAKKEIDKAIDNADLREELYPNVQAALRNWYTGGHRDWVMQYEVVAIEPEFTLPLVMGARPIGGYIDAIYLDRDTNTRFVVDHKTAKDFSRWRNADGHRHQAAMYAAALVLSDDFPEITELPEMVYMVTRTSISTRKDFEPTRIIRVQPDFEDVRMLGDRIREAEAKVASENYQTKTNWPLCSAKWCPFYEGCQVDGTLSGSPSDVRERMRQQSVVAQSQMQGSREAQSVVETPNDTEEV